MNIFVTGGAGFIGSSLCDKLLKNGESVIVLDNFNDYYDPSVKESNVKANLNNPKYKIIRGDIEDPVLVDEIFSAYNIDAVVHIAARAGVRPSLDSPLKYILTNVGGTTSILSAMVKSGVKKLLFASSSSVYGNCRETKFTEDLIVSKPISPYAASKAAGEQLCYTFHHLYGIQVICLRFFTVYGPRQRPDLAISKFTDLILNDKPITMYGTGDSMRDYTYIDDIVNGVVAALAYSATGFEIINLGSGNPITLSRMISTIEKHLNTTAKIIRHPNQPGDVDKTICDWTKACALLGFSPKTDFDEGICKFIQWKTSR